MHSSAHHVRSQQPVFLESSQYLKYSGSLEISPQVHTTSIKDLSTVGAYREYDWETVQFPSPGESIYWLFFKS
ncbi:Protein of unknown function [Pyronema omphalodes CBS 100304]|uniref:Uncharacterized protein n=1 Tax=Pyronema omphalodes (strain CBS 100304) TaxID=1076935 RepID=U4LV00_PYROM|nr:Protein of unknown function [Pyronema omphalodes CBS 100304]